MKNKIDFNSAVEKRRSIYGISNENIISDERIKEIVNFAVKHAPTAFNSQSGKVVVLLGQNHNKLWDITKDALRKVVPANNFTPTEEKIDSFAQGYGTILFLEDMDVVEGLQKQFPLYADNFPNWSQQSNGMLQFIVWTSLELEGFGASLQHYNPLIDSEVKKEWNIPATWKLFAQMPFGKVITPPSDKEFMPMEDRVKFY